MRILFILLAALVNGCLYDRGLGTQSAATVNVYNMKDLRIGMTEEEVFRIMRYPDREDQLVVGDGCYVIWFYITRATAMDQGRLVPRNLTPIIFKDGIFVGVGYDYYNWLADKSQSSVEPLVEQSSKTNEPQQIEDKKIEEVLKPAKSTFILTAKEPTPKIPLKDKPQKPKDPKTEPKKNGKEEPSKSPYEMNEKDKRMLEDAQEENFNNW